MPFKVPLFLNLRSLIPPGCLLWLSLALLGFEPPPAGAEDPGGLPESHPRSLEEVEVSATRSTRRLVDIPGAVTRSEVQPSQRALPGMTLAEPLQGVPGVFVLNPFNFAQDIRLAIRGFGARAPFGVRGLRILVDGIPQTLADGQTPVDSLDPSLMESLEVLRGPASSLFGNASGGLVSIETEQGGGAPLTVEPRLLFGRFGLQRQQVKAGGTLGNWNYFLYGHHTRWEGFRRHSETESTLASLKLIHRSDSGWTTQLVARRFDSPQAADPGALTSAEVAQDPQQANPRNLEFDAGEAVRQETLGLLARKRFSGAWEASLTAYVHHRAFGNRLPFVNGGQVVFDRWAPGLSAQLIRDLVWSPRFPVRLLSGFDYQYQNDDRQRYENRSGRRGPLTLNQREEVHNLGVYLRGELQGNGAWDLASGIRYDRLEYRVGDRFLADADQSGSRRLDQVNWSAGGVWHLTEAHHGFFNAATVFEAPTTTELINDPAGNPGLNPGLGPQTSRSYELGIKGGDRLNYELVLFWIETEGEIVPFEQAAFPGRTFFSNAGESRRRGLEAQAAWQPESPWTLHLAYAYSDFIFTRFQQNGSSLNGRRLPGVPVHHLQGRLSYRHRNGWFGRLALEYVGELFADNVNASPNPAHVRSRLEAGWQWTGSRTSLTLFLGLQNLLNQEYNANVRLNAAAGRFFEPAPPIQVFGGLSLAHGVFN